MGKTLIHIGYPKTGTTWFQNFFFPSVGNYDLMERSDIKNLFIEPFGINFNLKETQDYISKKYSDNLIISDERILGGMYSGGYNGFATKIIIDRIKQVFPNAQIIIFLRNQVDEIASTYYHYIMYGGTYSIKKFLFPKPYFVIQNIGLFSFNFFNYFNLINFLKSNFSIVDIYLFEDFNNDNLNFINLLIKKYSFDININQLNFSKSNMRYRKGLVPLRKICNIFTKNQLIYKYYLINIPRFYNFCYNTFAIFNKYIIFGKTANSKYLLSKKNVLFIKNYYLESNKLLYEELKSETIKEYYF